MNDIIIEAREVTRDFGDSGQWINSILKLKEEKFLAF